MRPSPVIPNKAGMTVFAEKKNGTAFIKDGRHTERFFGHKKNPGTFVPGFVETIGLEPTTL